MTTPDTATANRSIADELRAAAARKKKTRRAIAEDLKVSPMWVQRRLSGDQAISVEDVVKLAKSIGVDPLPLLELALTP